MAPLTIRIAIAETLDDLGKDDFDRFCFVLREHRGEPRVSNRDVKDKTVLEVTDVLVQRFTEHGALKVVLDTLRQIGCHQLANTLELKTKACVDNGDPTFRKNSQGELDLTPSPAAEAAKRPSAAAGGPPPKTPEQVAAEAKDCVLAEGGDSNKERLILSRYTMQFGQYRDKTFKWLLENDAGYTAWVLAKHQLDRQQNSRQDALMSNKDSLAQYGKFYPEVLKEVRSKYVYEKAKEESQRPRQSGAALVGFGKYTFESLKNLYESKDKDKISYVEFLRGQKTSCIPGSRMEDAIRYILQRDKRQAAAKKRWTRAKCSQSTSSSWPMKKKQKGSWRRT